MNLFRSRYADGARLDLGGVTVRLRVSARARRISLRIDRASGEAIAVAPSAARLADAVAFARERQAWVAERLAERPAPRALRAGDTLALLGIPCRLEPDGRRPRLIAGETARIVGCGLGEVDPQLVIRLIKRQALAAFVARGALHCAALGVPPPPISMMDARTRWGSCTPAHKGRPASIRLSWRLALAPFEVADYVVAHECAHLLEANHGPGFWSLVRDLVGDPGPHRAWLRAEGAKLHGFGG
jgi:predicted metal-dependent hydrolase